MTGPATQEGAEALAEHFGKLADMVPDGTALLVFLMADMGSHFETTVAATCAPDQFAPVIRRWLERYDAGELMATSGLRASGTPDA
jgi:hypothetical protein